MDNNSMSFENNKMGIMNVPKLLITMSGPMMISMLVQSIYNIVDSLFVSRLDPNAVTALGHCFPIQILLIAFGTGTGVGINAILSKALGENDPEKANKAAVNGVFLAVIWALMFVLVGFFFVNPYFGWIKAEAPIIREYGRDYLSIVCIFSIGIFMQCTFERLLQATGRSLLSMFSQLFGAIINLVLDPIMIFGLCGMPALGVKGAALATVIGQMGAGLFAFILNKKFNKEISLSFKGFRPDLDMIGKILIIGIPSIIMQAIGCVMNLGMNYILGSASDDAMFAFTAYYKVQSFFFMPVFGLNSGLVPIIAFNYGAKKKKRITETVKFGIIYAEAFMVLGSIVCLTIPSTLISLFNPLPNQLQTGIIALRIICIHFPIAAICIVLGTMFQAMGNAWCSMVVSICRQLVALLPAAWLLSLSGNINNVWWAFPIAEIMSLVVSLGFTILTKKTKIDKINEGISVSE